MTLRDRNSGKNGFTPDRPMDLPHGRYYKMQNLIRLAGPGVVVRKPAMAARVPRVPLSAAS
jgi:hypothetical protein